MSHSIVKRCLVGLTLLTLSLLMANAAYAQVSMSIGMTVTPTSEEDAQGRITYTATVANSGATTANNVVVTFTMPYIELPITSNPQSCVFTYNGPLFATCPVGNVAGNNGHATATVVVYPTNVGTLLVTATATDANSTNDTVSIEDGSTLTGVGIADVLVELAANPNPAYVGAPLTYSVTAFNIGDDDAQNVVVSLAMPPDMTFVSATKPCTHSLTLVNCKIGHMVVNGSATFNITVLPKVSGWTFATALLRGESVADPSALNNSAASRIWINP
jgi:uncharacterized repeat protein (TIGR01451 family)